MKYLVVIFMLTLACSDNHGYSVCTLEENVEWKCTEPVWLARDGKQFNSWDKVSCHKLGSFEWHCLPPVNDPRDFIHEEK
jgi:hypothetical protein